MMLFLDYGSDGLHSLVGSKSLNAYVVVSYGAQSDAVSIQIEYRYFLKK